MEKIETNEYLVFKLADINTELFKALERIEDTYRIMDIRIISEDKISVVLRKRLLTKNK